jgi:hypothetical protein
MQGANSQMLLLPDFLHYAIQRAWSLVPFQSGLFSTLFPLHNALDIARQVFTTVERYHNLSPIPLHHCFIRACLYFHPNVSCPNFHSDYRKYLQFAIEVLKAAHNILHYDMMRVFLYIG